MRLGEHWGVNGAGRIGYRLLAENELLNRKDIEREDGVDITAINEPFKPIDQIMAELRHDLMHGSFPGEVTKGGNDFLYVNGRRVRVTSEREPAKAWKEEKLFGVLEASGQYRKKADAAQHLDNVRHVLITAPSPDSDLSLVYGINNAQFTGQRVVDNASCTTKSALPPIKILDEAFGIQDCNLETIHAATGPELQRLMQRFRTKALETSRPDDVDWILDESTGAAVNVVRILPKLEGRFRARAKRVPTLNNSLSIMDMVFNKEDVTVAQVREALIEGAKRFSQGVIGIVDKMPSSRDLASSNDDAVVPLDRVEGRKVFKVVSGYNNERGPARNAIQTARLMEDHQKAA